MPTLVERIEKIARNETLSQTEKVEKYKVIAEKYQKGRTELIRALSEIVPSTKQDGDQTYREAANVLLTIGTRDSRHASAAIVAMGKIKKAMQDLGIHEREGGNSDLFMYIPPRYDRIFRNIVSVANSSEIFGATGRAAEIIADINGTDAAKNLNNLATNSGEAPSVMDALTELARASKDDEDVNSEFQRDIQNTRHDIAVQAIANIAKAERHPEYASDAFKALQKIGSERAAVAITNLMRDHFEYRIRKLPEGKLGNPPHNNRNNYKNVPLNPDGFAALSAMGDTAVDALLHLSFNQSYDQETYSWDNIDEASAKGCIDALKDINTPKSLKTIAQIALNNPAVEDYALNTLRDIHTGQAASALVDFGAGERFGASEAFSARANSAFGKILYMYSMIRYNNLARGEVQSVKKAAAELATAITSDDNLRKRFFVGERSQQGVIGRNIHHHDFRGGFTDREGTRIPVKRKRKDVKAEVKGLRRSFKTAKHMGLLEKGDPSLIALNAFDAHDRAQRKLQKARAAASYGARHMART